MKLSSQKIFLIGFILVGLGSVPWLFSSISTHETSRRPEATTLSVPLPVNSSREDDGRDYWAQRIDELGAENAYGAFKERYRVAEIGTQHTKAHLFGKILFEKIGSEGAAICDDSFAYGCYHSFFDTALREKGTSSIAPFDSACIRRWQGKSPPCQHGIGHGLLAYLGSPKLKESLELCASLPSWQPLGGCTSGVFMEYNFRNENHDGVIHTRALDVSNPYSPCPSLPAKFQQSCYFEQIQWWQSVFSGDHEKIGLLCNGITDGINRESCFLGIGNFAAPFLHYDLHGTIAICNALPARVGIIRCREAASWIFLSYPETSPLAAELCYGLGGEPEEECLQKLRANPFQQKN